MISYKMFFAYYFRPKFLIYIEKRFLFFARYFKKNIIPKTNILIFFCFLIIFPFFRNINIFFNLINAFRIFRSKNITITFRIIYRNFICCFISFFSFNFFFRIKFCLKISTNFILLIFFIFFYSF